MQTLVGRNATTVDSMTTGFTDHDVPDQSGRTFLVTGANTGLGLETARVLAGKGARVLMGCRTESKATAAMRSIEKDVPGADLAFVELDQADLAAVRSCADAVSTGEDRLDVLVNNAGIMMPPRELTADGFESQLGVNHLGTFALTGLLLPKLADGDAGRVVITSSLAHIQGEIDFDDLTAEHDYSRQARYQQSKLANILHMYELDRRLRAADASTIAVACHPGIANTDLARHLGPLKLLVPVVRPFFNSAAQGAWPTLQAATDPSAAGGDYYGPTKRGETSGPSAKARSSSRARNPELAARLWDVSVELTGVDPQL